MKRDTNCVSESTVAMVRSNVLAEAGRIAVCWSANGMSLNLRTEMVTVLSADVRSWEFVAEYLRVTHMCEQGGGHTRVNKGSTHMCEQRGHIHV